MCRKNVGAFSQLRHFRFGHDALHRGGDLVPALLVGTPDVTMTISKAPAPKALAGFGQQLCDAVGMTEPTVPSRVPAGATTAGDGIVLGAGPVRVDAFIDFLCPYCRRFELGAAPVLAGLVSDGLISLAYHPMNFLDEASTTGYSTRAAAASGCAADQDRFAGYAHALFVSQPPEGGPGLTDEELVDLGVESGLSAEFTSCLASGPYLDWPPYVTARAVSLGVTVTPTVPVAGAAVPPDARAISAAVAAAR